MTLTALALTQAVKARALEVGFDRVADFDTYSRFHLAFGSVGP